MGRLVWRWSIIKLRFILPLVFSVLICMGRLALTSVLAFWIGIPEAVRRIVRSLMGEAWSTYILTEYDTILRWLFTIVAYILIFLGWVGFSYLTVFIIAWLI